MCDSLLRRVIHPLTSVPVRTHNGDYQTTKATAGSVVRDDAAGQRVYRRTSQPSDVPEKIAGFSSRQAQCCQLTYIRRGKYFAK